MAGMPAPLPSSSKPSQPHTADLDAPPDPEASASGAKKPLRLRTQGGELVEVDSLNVPDAVKKLLYEMDLDGTGEVSEDDFAGSLKILRSMKAGLDTDGSGGITNAEMEAGVELLTRLMKQGKENTAEMEYRHLPACIQDVMKEWDADGSGKVGAAELAAAAQAYRKVQQEGRLMRKIILVMAIVILLLMASMFVLSYAAVDMAKEMRGKKDGVMSTPSGAVVKVGSSDYEMLPDGSLVIRGAPVNATCPAGQTCRRLGAASGSNALKVAASETSRGLSSTLPDTAFKELKSLTLKDNSDHSLKVSITSFQRLSLRSSKCGSVVHLYSDQGRLTLDDYDMMADAQMEAYAQAAGMGSLFESGPVSGFGRRLASTDGMLEGFFNLLDDVEWKCESVSLPSPKDIPQYYVATVEVRHLHENPEEGLSRLFMDQDGMAIPLAGIEIANVSIYKHWQEEIVQAGAVQGIRSTFGMDPYTTEIRIKQGGAEIRLEENGGMGFRCQLHDAGSTLIGAASQGSDAELEFVGVVVEGGIVLRQWRMHLIKEGDEANMDPTFRAMVEGGLLPNAIDYFDVDTDSANKFSPGQPYRIRMYSTVAGGKVDTQKQYISITPLPAALDLQGVADQLSLKRLDTACEMPSPIPDAQDAQDLLAKMSAALEVTNTSLTVPGYRLPPELSPWQERSASVVYIVQALSKAYLNDVASPKLKAAKGSPYWTTVLKYNSQAVADLQAQMNAGPSAVPGRRLGSWTPGEQEGEYSVRYTPEDFQFRRGRVPKEFEGRRLGSERLLEDATKWGFSATVTAQLIQVKIDVGEAGLDFKTEYCNLLNASWTNYAACKSGRKDSGDIVVLDAAAHGSQILFPWPTVSVAMGGKVSYEDTEGVVCKLGTNVFLRPPAARNKTLQENVTSNFTLTFGPSAKWVLVDSGYGGVFIQSPSKKYLTDNGGSLALSASPGQNARWQLRDAGEGVVYFRSAVGKNYLGVQEFIPPTQLPCNVTLYRDTKCRGNSVMFSSFNTTGEEMRPTPRSDDNWESAKTAGACGKVEFYDEDNDRPNDGDNLWANGPTTCMDFNYDLSDDMSGIRIFAQAVVPGEFLGKLTLYSEANRGLASQWAVLNDDATRSSACENPSFSLSGMVTFAHEIKLILGIKLEFEVNIGASYSRHPIYGGYVSSVFGIGKITAGPASVYVKVAMKPTEPWFNKYKLWQLCVSFGYVVNTLIVTYQSEFTLFCQDLDFRR